MSYGYNRITARDVRRAKEKHLTEYMDCPRGTAKMWNPALGQWVCGDTGGRHWHDPEWGGYGRLTPPRYYGGSSGSSYGGYGFYGGDPLLTTAYANTERSDTLQFQNLLVAAGFGSMLGRKGADGFFGDKTAAATRAYQSAKGLPVTGTADQATWNALKGVGGAGGAGGAGGGQRGAWDWVADVAQGLTAGLTGQPANAGTGSGSMVTGAGTPAAGAPATTDGKFPWKWVWIGLGSVVVIGGTIYFVRKKK